MMRVVEASGRGLPAMTRAQHAAWVTALVALGPAVVAVTEQWFPRYLRSLRRHAPGYRIWCPLTLPWGNQGTGLAWKHDQFTLVEAKVHRLHGPVFHRLKCISGVRRFAYAILRDEDGREFAVAAVHTTPHLYYPSALRAWLRAMHRLNAWVIAQVEADRPVLLLGDFNAGPHRMRDFWGSDVHGAKVRIVTSPTGYRIDHAVFIGAWTVRGHGVKRGTPSDHDPLWVNTTLS